MRHRMTCGWFYTYFLDMLQVGRGLVHDFFFGIVFVNWLSTNLVYNLRIHV